MTGSRKTLLSDKQRDGLLEKRDLSPVGRRVNNKTCREKLEYYLKSASDALLILERLPALIENLPDEDKRKILDPDYVDPLLRVTENFIELLDFKPVVAAPSHDGKKLDDEQVHMRYKTEDENGTYTMDLYRPATKEEIKLYNVVSWHADAIRCMMDDEKVRSETYEMGDFYATVVRDESKRGPIMVAPAHIIPKPGGAFDVPKDEEDD